MIIDQWSDGGPPRRGHHPSVLPRTVLTPLSVLDGRQVTTIEGLGTAEVPSPMQQAFIDEQAAQCGYCIAGMIMRAEALLQAKANPSGCQMDPIVAEVAS